jgi:hypothetical protein
MKALSGFSCPLLALTFLLTGGNARAEMIDFSYGWTVSPSPPVYSSGTGVVAVSAYADSSASATLGGTATLIPGASISTNSSASAAQPDHFDVAYSMTLHLTDAGSSQAADLTFSGTLAGELTSGSSTLKSSFHNPVTQQTTLGGHLYSVTIDPVMADISVGPAAQINALVKVGGQTQPTSQQTPEPSTLLLAGLALPLFGVAWKRRKDSRSRG